MAETKEAVQPTYKHLSGEEHPDNNPPLQTVAPVSPEKTKEIEDAVNAELAANAPEGIQPLAGEPKVEQQNLEEHTVAELKDIAAEKGIAIPWDANKHDIIKAIKKGK